MMVFAFYESYTQLSRSQKTPEWRPLLVKSIRRAGVCFLLLVVFTISQMVCKHYHAGFVISFMISVLISLSFLGCYRLFNIKNPDPSDDSTRKKGKENKELTS